MARPNPFLLLPAALLWLLVSAGCSGLLPLPAVQLDIDQAPATIDYAPLDSVLFRCVRAEGQLVTRALTDQAETLDRQLRILAVTGPTATPEQLVTREQKLAYWYNARAAWSMKLALLADFELTRPLEDHMNRSIPLDGRQMSIAAIDRTLGEDEDFRVAAAAPGVSYQTARLPERAFGPEDILERVERRFEGLLDDPRRVIVDIDAQDIRWPRVIWQMRDRIRCQATRRYGLVEPTLRTALLWHVGGSAHRRLQDAIGYRDRARTSKLELVDLIDY
ncbi:MAG: hypothetical protein ACLFUJ_12800 [Phycisphaerae bacterium]